MGFVCEGFVEFISKEQGVELMWEDFGDDFLKFDLFNFLYDVIIFNVKVVYMYLDSLKGICIVLIECEGIIDVYYQESLVNDIVDNIKMIGIVVLVILVLFFGVVGLFIYNIVCLVLYVNCFLIKNMELVGVIWEFISWLFLCRVMIYGLFSGVLVFGVLLFLYFYVQVDVFGLWDIQDWIGMFILFGLLLIMGMAINMVSIFLVVCKYLKMRVDDFY